MNARQPPATELPVSTWPAQLQLRLEQRAGVGTRLVKCTHRGPLRLQRPFYPEGADCAHLYLLHPPGGLVSGDDLAIDVNAGPDTQVLLTTPGAGRIYRARTAYQPARQTQRVQLTIATGAILEWLPQPTIVFDGADLLLDLHVDLAPTAGFIGWEVLCLGRPASALPFESGAIEQRWRVYRDGVPLLHDRLCMAGDDSLRSAYWGLQGQPVYGTFLAVPPQSTAFTHENVETLRSLLDSIDAASEIAVTLLRGMVVVRYLGVSTERAHTLFDLCWGQLRPVLNRREAVRPRIWNT